MVYRRTDGLWPVAQLRHEMNRLVGDYFGGEASGQQRWDRPGQGFPALNVWEEGDALWAEAEVPGMKSEDIDISVVGSDLTIRGRRGVEMREGVAYHRQERGVGEFNRVLRLPFEVNSAKVEATLTDGVLLVKLPKAESAKPKKIKVNPSK